jgi:hypothetical protein
MLIVVISDKLGVRPSAGGEPSKARGINAGPAIASVPAAVPVLDGEAGASWPDRRTHRTWAGGVRTNTSWSAWIEPAHAPVAGTAKEEHL